MTPPSHSLDRTVTIVIHDQLAHVSPNVELVRDELVYHRREVSFPSGHARWEDHDINMWFVGDDDQLCIPAGCVPRVVTLLEQADYQVRLDDQRLGPPEHVPDAQFMATLDGADRTLANAVAESHGGFLRLASEREMLSAVGLIARLHHDAQVLVAAATNTECNKIYGTLLSWVGGNVGRVQPGVWFGPQRVAVATLGKLEARPLDDWHIVLLPYAETAVRAKIVAQLWRDRDQRVYALSAFRGTIQPMLALRLEAVAGPTIYDSLAGTGPAPIHVHFCDGGLRGGDQFTGTALARKRAMIWHNDGRNALIARTAQAIADRDRDRLAQLGLGRVDWPERAADLSPTLPIILVEALEHARELAGLLPGWVVQTTAVGSSSHTVCPQSPPTSPPLGLIVTHMAALTMSVGPDQILIRADGGPHDIELPALDPSSNRAPITLVDFADATDDQSSEEMRSRIAHYRARGWTMSCPSWLTNAGREHS